jgi:DNA-binding MurR/RpiR family transcriptional regulator
MTQNATEPAHGAPTVQSPQNMLAPHGTDNDASAAADRVLIRLREARDDLSGALAQVADYVLAEPAAAARSTITELAERVGTSPGTVTRFCRALGFSGYAELRVALAEDAGRAAGSAEGGRWASDIGGEIRPGDSAERIVGVVLGTVTRAIHDTAEQIDLGGVDEFVQALLKARRIDFFGVGNSAIAARELQFRLHRIGIACWAWSDVHNALTSAAQLGPDDLAVGISHSGRVRETIEVLELAAGRGARTVALTGDPRSPLARTADLVLAGHAPGLSTPGAPDDALAGRYSQMFLLDVVYTRLAQLNHSETVTTLDTTARAVAAHRLAD